MQTHFGKLVLLSTLLSGCALGQVVEVQRPPVQDDSLAPKVRAFDYTHLKDRPYSFDLPKPSFPSTPRVQREFVVEYLYDYAISTYTPAVPMPVVPAGQGKRDTPENALITIYAAMRRGDYAEWLAGWDEAGQKQLAADAKSGKMDSAAWLKLWRQVFSGAKSVVLIDRVETASAYVLLDVQLPGTNFSRVPNVFKFIKGQWLQTNDLSSDPIVYQMRPDLAGVVNTVPPVAASALDKENTLEAQAQAHFLEDRAKRDRVVLAGK